MARPQQPLALLAALALLLAAAAPRPAAAGIVQSDQSELCTSNLAACEQQCITAGQFAFQCDQGGTFTRPSSTCKCVKVPPGIPAAQSERGWVTLWFWTRGAGERGCCRVLPSLRGRRPCSVWR